MSTEEGVALTPKSNGKDDPIFRKLYSNHLLAEKVRQLFYTFLLSIILTSLAEVLKFLGALHFKLHSDTEIMDVLKNTGAKLHQGTNTRISDTESQFYNVTILGIYTLGAVFALLMISSPKVKESTLCPHFAAFTWSTVILVPIAIRNDIFPLREGLGWVILETFFIWITLPVKFKVAFVHAVFLGFGHSFIVVWKGKHQSLMLRQLATNVVLLAGANILGMIGYYFHDRRQRQAFEDVKQTINTKDEMEAAMKEQKRLLFSVLPRHLAQAMAKDMENARNENSAGAFKKIYMNRHEPVSILFADIVGFTAMSAAIGSAAKLVEILNDLFSAFDSLADKYKQVRIKILGDCYYCICGAPEEQPDHAVLCVYMGLAVVDAIKVFQKRTNSAVDMRVGIHTGSLLAGVIGQRQWQFDVYSKDVELANKLESSGIPGRVHISNRTLNFLNNEFEVEPGAGETKEEKLKMAGIKTYLITNVLIPFDGDDATDKLLDVAKSDLEIRDNYINQINGHMKSQKGNFWTQANPMTLRFHDKDKEHEYLEQFDHSTGPSYLGLANCLVAISIASILAISFNNLGFAISSGVLFLIFGIGTLIIGGRFWIHDKPILHCGLTIVCILGIFCVESVFLMPCYNAGAKSFRNSTISGKRSQFGLFWVKQNCYFPSYFIIFSTISLLALTIISKMPSWLKNICGLLVVGVAGCFYLIGPLRKAVLYSEIFTSCEKNNFSWNPGTEMVDSLAFLGIIFIILSILSRQLEISHRSIFVQKLDVSIKREHAEQFKKKNEALMCNILPQHVADHFMSRASNTNDLYSSNYQEVGVLFASMPNFADFYTEDAVNNQGLECLRFLNEVISDYDALLSHTKFLDRIIKIKTIGSTYMAASGLNPNNQAQPGDNFRERWRHLSLLVDFVLEMKRVLDHINTESYNKFVLKIGVNHGPVTAGVIGATKPAYDIWGNTVNVASRMESTGKIGKIQVTDECYKILRIYGYKFEQRGFVSVKGKGQIMTYFLIGKGNAELTDLEVEVLEKAEREVALVEPQV